MPMDSTGFGAALVPTHLLELTAAEQALVTGWLKAAERRNCQPSTRKGYGGALKAFIHSWDGHRPVSLLQVERSHIEHFLDHLEGRGLNPSTINTLLGCVQRFYGHLIREEQLAVSPVRAQHYLHEPEPLPRALSDEQVSRFLAGIEPVLDQAVFLLLLRSGIRLGEVVALELGNVELEHHQLYIRRGHKNRRSRVVYFSADAGQAVRRWLEDRWSQPLPQLFHNREGRPLHHRWVQRHFRASAERAGLERHLTVHSLRHTFACQLLNAGVDLVTLQELLGHDSILLTQRYARLSDRRRRAEYFEAITHIEQGVHDEPRATQPLSSLPAATCGGVTSQATRYGTMCRP